MNVFLRSTLLCGLKKAKLPLPLIHKVNLLIKNHDKNPSSYNRDELLTILQDGVQARYFEC